MTLLECAIGTVITVVVHLSKCRILSSINMKGITTLLLVDAIVTLIDGNVKSMIFLFGS